MPFETVLLIYAVIGGIPLILVGIITIIYRNRLKAPPFRWNWDYGLGLLSFAAPLSAIIIFCVRLITFGRPFLSLLSQQIGFFASFFVAGGVFYGLRLLFRHQRET